MNKLQIKEKVSDFIDSHPPTELWRIVLLVSLFFSICVQTQVIIIPNPSLEVAIIFATLFTFPGFLLITYLYKPKDFSLLQLPSISSVLGIGLLIIPATILLVLHTHLEYLIWISVIINTGLVLLHILKPNKDLNIYNFISQQGGVSGRTILLFLLFSAIIVWGLYYYNSIAAVWAYGDRWAYTGWIKQYLEFPHLDFSDPRYANEGNLARSIFGGWLVLEALFSYISGIGPIDLFSLYLPPILMVISLLCFYTFAEELFQDSGMALFASLLQIIYLSANIKTGHVYEAGFMFFMRLPEDKITAVMILMPIVLLMMLRYLRFSSGKYLTVFSIGVASLALTHPFGLPLFAISFGSFAIVYLFFNMNWNTIRKLAIIFLIICILLIFPLLQKLILNTQGEFVSIDAAKWLNQDVEFLANSYHLQVLANGRYMAHWDLIKNRLTMFSILLIPLLLVYIRHSLTAQFLFSNIAIPLILIFNPITAPILGLLITPVLLQRISWVFPISLIVGFSLYILAQFIRRWLLRFSFLSHKPWILQIAPLFLVLMVFFLKDDINESIELLSWRLREKSIPQNEQELLNYLSDTIIADSIVLANSYTCYYIPSYSTKANLVIGSIKNPDVQKFYKTEFIDNIIIDILRKYDVRFIILKVDSNLVQQFDLMPTIFSKIFKNEAFVLFQIVSDLPSGNTLTGFIHLAHGELGKAIAAFNGAIVENPENTLAYYALAQVYKIQGRMEDAIKIYRKIITFNQNTGELTKHLAEELKISPSYVLDYLAKGEMYQTWLSPNVALNLLDRINEANIISSIDSNLIYRSAFIIDQQPKGVIFQHPPSSIEYKIEIPDKTKLDFALSMAPEVWFSNKGDGVQFDIYIEDGNISWQLFSEYIDPKNIPNERHWLNRELDLSSWAGKTVTLIFSTDPGPNNNSVFDWAGWGEPRIVQPIAYSFLEHFAEAITTTQQLGQVYTQTQTINYETRPIIFQHPTSRVYYSVILPQRATLAFGLGVAPEVWSPEKGDGVEYNIYIQKPNEPYVLHRVYHRYLDPKNNPDDRCWFDERVDLSRYGGSTVSIIFEALPGPAGNANFDWGGWSAPMLIDDTLPENARIDTFSVGNTH